MVKSTSCLLVVVVLLCPLRCAIGCQQTVQAETQACGCCHDSQGPGPSESIPRNDCKCGDCICKAALAERVAAWSIPTASLSFLIPSCRDDGFHFTPAVSFGRLSCRQTQARCTVARPLLGNWLL